MWVHLGEPEHTYLSDCSRRRVSKVWLVNERRNETANTHNSSQHLIQHCSKAPPINFVAVRQALNDLRCEVLGGPAKGCRHIWVANRLSRPPDQHIAIFIGLHPRGEDGIWRSRGRGVKITAMRTRGCGWQWAIRRHLSRELLGEAKVGQNDMPIACDENVLGFEISINDASGMEPLNTFDDLCGVETGAVSTESAPSCELRGKISSRVEVLSGGKVSWSSRRRQVWKRTITKNRFSLSWKLHQSLTTKGSFDSAAILFKTACSVRVCCSSWCARTWRLVIALSAKRPWVFLCRTSNTLPAHPLPRTRIISKSSTVTFLDEIALLAFFFLLRLPVVAENDDSSPVSAVEEAPSWLGTETV